MNSILDDEPREIDIRNGHCYNGEVLCQIPHYYSFTFYLYFFLLATSILRGNYHQYFCFDSKLRKGGQ